METSIKSISTPKQPRHDQGLSGRILPQRWGFGKLSLSAMTPIFRKLLFIIVVVIVSDPPLPHSTPRCFYVGGKMANIVIRGRGGS